ncbi:hypothetical protein CAPTEDRAFT_224055 [Capitella teleta]|uniref:Uncharacterized protein n=1 Tax=Capitella teleta TaxID=283909 RepID=R7T986_CAPTE|nr:hypothetical protein CAPTEDRAFT_224055 [Capitella teleta]|eukprot:ELT87965.1 hypothetical protein CAPTEDRAFT_224055 [Capitella teleta]
MVDGVYNEAVEDIRSSRTDNMLRFVLLFCLMLASGNGSKILLLPTPFTGHLNYFVPLGKALVDEGHEVHIILSTGSKGVDLIQKQGIKVMQYLAEDGICHLVTDSFYKNVSLGMLENPDPRLLAGIVAPAVAKECEFFLKDDSVLKQAKKVNFDLAVVDGLFFARCLYLFPVKLEIPYVTLTTFQEFWMMKVPAMPSHVPFHYLGFTQKMTFPQRMINTLVNIVWVLGSGKSPELPDVVKDRYSDVIARVDFDSLILKSKLWFFNSDISLDYPKPSMPNVVNIGGMSPKPAKPLEEELMKWMDGSTNGVVVASFGSVISYIPLELSNKLLKAFAELPYNVLWRNKNITGLTVPDNVRVMSWLPQNDVLGHPNTVAFVTHCGNNGQFEALYHKVPMIGLPVFADQPYNGLRMEQKGFGINMDIRTFKPEELTHNILRVATEPSFRTNIAKGSGIFKSRQSRLAATVAFWLEHVVEHGGDHLRSHAMDMPAYQYLLLDVFAVFFLVTLFVLAMILFLCRGIFRMFAQVRQGSEKEKNE